jgi:hypothetical protein
LTSGADRPALPLLMVLWVGAMATFLMVPVALALMVYGIESVI